MTARWRDVDAASLPDSPGWHYQDPSMSARLAASVRIFGQLRPVVVATGPGGLQVVDGRKLLEALRAAGHSRVTVADLGERTAGEITDAMLALACGFEIDYAKLAYAVAARLAGGSTPDELSMMSPFTSERIGYFGKLAAWDWSEFEKGQEQSPLIDWDAQPDEEAAVLPLPPDATAGELAAEAGAVPPETPAAEVVQHLAEHKHARRERPGQALLEF